MTTSQSGFWSVLVFMERELELLLVRRLRAGDTAAFDEVYSAFNPRLFRFLNRMTRNRHVAEDLVEETWLRLVSGCEDLDEDTRLGAWLFTVARNLYISTCRAGSRQQSCAIDFLSLWPDVLSPSPLSAAVSNEFEERLEAALAALPPIYREALVLVGIEGFRPAEAAAVCGIGAEAFRQRLSRARALLWERLNTDGWIEKVEWKKVGR